jgi:hypothetical protein
MAKEENQSSFKRLRNRYRLVVMNDDTYEEVVTFKLSRLSVYIGMSTIFIVMVGLTIALLVLTPLKQYLPGKDSWRNRQELQNLKYRTDSLEKAMMQKDQYLKSIKAVLTGNTPTEKDTSVLNLPNPEISRD